MLTIPDSSFKLNDVEFLFSIAYGIRYDHAIVFIRYSSCYPPDDTELETFRQAVHNRLGYKNILFGTAVENNECESKLCCY